MIDKILVVILWLLLIASFPLVVFNFIKFANDGNYFNLFAGLLLCSEVGFILGLAIRKHVR